MRSSAGSTALLGLAIDAIRFGAVAAENLKS